MKNFIKESSSISTFKSKLLPLKKHILKPLENCRYFQEAFLPSMTGFEYLPSPNTYHLPPKTCEALFQNSTDSTRGEVVERIIIIRM